MKRIEIETALNESRTWLLETFTALTEEQLRRPLTPSEHDPANLWYALDHFSHLALIETNFARMIRRHLSGEANPVGLLEDEHGSSRSRGQIMALVHEMTDDYQREHHADSFSTAVALGARARGATLQLLSELSDEQLDQALPGAPWSDGTIGAVIKVNADHARMHWGWLVDASLLAT